MVRVMTEITSENWRVKSAGHGSLFNQYWINLGPLLILTLSLNIVLV